MPKNQRVGSLKETIMRKIFYLLVLFLSVTLASNGQYFVGGGLGFSTTGGKTEAGSLTTTKPSTFEATIAPQAGFILSDKVWVGLSLSLGYESTNDHGDPEVINQSTSLGIAPFARYYFFQTGKFSVFGQAQARARFMSTKVKTGNTSDMGPKRTMIGLNAFPGMAYDISEKCQLYTVINAFSLGISTNIIKDGDSRDVSTSAGFDVNTNSIFNIGALTVGAYFRF